LFCYLSGTAKQYKEVLLIKTFKFGALLCCFTIFAPRGVLFIHLGHKNGSRLELHTNLRVLILLKFDLEVRRLNGENNQYKALIEQAGGNLDINSVQLQV
jgi:hypothetical protein